MTGSFSREEKRLSAWTKRDRCAPIGFVLLRNDTKCSSRPFGGLTAKAVMMSHTS